MPLKFTDDADMLYAACRTQLKPGDVFRLDEPYRLAHLPLVAPAHPDVIAEGGGYRMGIHAPAYSLVLPVDAKALATSEGYRALEAALRSSVLSGKIAWDVMPKRAGRLHATLCGGVLGGSIPEAERAKITAEQPIGVEVRGLFSGNRNLGRLYLAVYPELQGGEQAFAPVQRALGRQPNALFLIGMFNLIDHLDVHETAALESLLTVFRSTLFLRAIASEVRVLCSTDDLVLDAAYTDSIMLGCA